MCLLVLTLAVVVTPSRADRVILKNAGVLEGVLVKENDSSITFLTKSGEVTLEKSSIKEIRKGEAFRIYLERGDNLLSQRNFVGAAENYERAKNTGCSEEIYRARIQSLEKARRVEADRDLLNNLKLAEDLRSKGFLDKGIETLSGLGLREKSDPRVKRLLADMLCSAAYEHIDHFQYGKAVESLIEARDLGAPKAKLHYLMGLLKRKEGRNALALYEFEEALHADPKVYTQFPDSGVMPLFPIPIETRMEVALTVEGDLEKKELEIGLDNQVALRDHLLQPRKKEPVSKGSRETNTILKHIEKYAKVNDLDPLLVEAVARVESALDASACSSAGAMGVMQLMPGTAKDMGVKDPYDPEENIRGGSKYLRMMLTQFKKTDLALAAYNAGPNTVKFYKGIPPYPETRRYVPTVLRELARLREARAEVALAE